MKIVKNNPETRRSLFAALWLPLLVCTAMLAGCTKDDALSGDDGDLTPVLFTTTIQAALSQASANAAPQTRTTVDINTSWTQGDAVGIYMLTTGGTLPDDVASGALNKEYSADAADGSLVPADGKPLYFPQNDGVDFIAYYPYASSEMKDNTISRALTDQTTAEKQMKCDILCSMSATNIRRSKNTVNLRFSHVMAKLKFDITLGLGLTGGSVTEVVLNDMPDEVLFDLRDGSAKGGRSTGGNSIHPLKLDSPSAGMDATYTAIVPSQEFGQWSGRTIVVTVNGTKYTGHIPDTDAYEAGNMYVYPITVRETGIEVGVPSGDVPWTDGDATVTLDVNGSKKSFRLIRTADDLARFAADVNAGNRDLNAIQTADIDLSDLARSANSEYRALADNWMPVNEGNRNTDPFTGIYNGNGYTISHLHIGSVTGYNAGLFGKIGSGALLTGIHLRGVVIRGEYNNLFSYSGALVGEAEADATISLCSAEGEINAKGLYSGGLVGYNYGTITRCRANVKVTADVTVVYQLCAYAGGITGVNSTGSLLFACWAQGDVVLTGKVDGTPDYNVFFAGGITGDNNGRAAPGPQADIYCCIAEGSVSVTCETADVYAGGLTGFHINGTITSCYARGTVTAKGTGTKIMAGAIVGRNYFFPISHCHGSGTTGQGTSNLGASPNDIVYNPNPGPNKIYDLISSGSIPSFADIPFTRYEPTDKPAYGMNISKMSGAKPSFLWKSGNGIYPDLDFTFNGN